MNPVFGNNRLNMPGLPLDGSSKEFPEFMSGRRSISSIRGTTPRQSASGCRHPREHVPLKDTLVSNGTKTHKSVCKSQNVQRKETRRLSLLWVRCRISSGG